MSRYSYDDMPPEGYKERGGIKKGSSLIIAFIGVLITLIAILLYLMFSPQGEGKEAEVSQPEPVEVDIAEPDIIESEISTEETTAEAIPAKREIVSDYKPLGPPSEYIVKEGDTLSSIASEFSVSVGTIIACNSITDIKDVVPGLCLLIPEISGSYYVAVSGDTADAIALHRNPSLTGDDILALNGLDRDLHAGDRIFIPSLGSNLSSGDNRFESPLPDGEVIYNYLDVYAGKALTGVVISGLPGSAVTASASGHVVDLPMDDYGKGVKILNDDGYYTVYEGLEIIFVKQADKVEKGQPIGSIGTSQMYFGTPAVFFQIEQEGVAIDPALMVEDL